MRYAARSDEEEFVNQRLEHLREFLATTGLDMSRVEVQVAMAGADHALAVDAIEAQEKSKKWSESWDRLWFTPEEQD